MGADRISFLAPSFLLASLGTQGCSGAESGPQPPTPCQVSAQCSGGQACNAGVCGTPSGQDTGPSAYESDVLFCDPFLNTGSASDSMVVPGNPAVTYLEAGPVVTIANYPFIRQPSDAKGQQLSSFVVTIRQGSHDMKTLPGFVTGVRTTSKGTFAITWVPEPAGTPGKVKVIDVADPGNPRLVVNVDPTVCNGHGEGHKTLYLAIDNQIPALSADILDDDGNKVLLGAGHRLASAGVCTSAYLAQKSDSGWQVEPIEAAKGTQLIEAFPSLDGTPTVIGDDISCQVTQTAGWTALARRLRLCAPLLRLQRFPQDGDGR